MIYSAAQIRLWPRLLTAAHVIDGGLESELRGLMASRAQLDVRNGALQLSAGTMDPAAYARVRDTVLMPRKERMRTIQDRARTAQHPWVPALQAAYLDLAERCSKGSAKLQGAVKTRDGALVQLLTPVLLDRHMQAQSVAMALYLGGYEAYCKYTSEHVSALIGLGEAARQSGIVHDLAHRPCSWPVETPDGWIWCTDAEEWQPVAVDGVHAPQEGELVITDQVLGAAILPLDQTIGSQREAG